MEECYNTSQGSWFLSERGSRLWRDVFSINHTHFFSEVEVHLKQLLGLETLYRESHVHRRPYIGSEGTHGIAHRVT